MSPVGAIFIPSPPNTGTNLLHPLSPPIVGRVTQQKDLLVRIENDYMNVRGAFSFFYFNNGIRFSYKFSSYSVYI